MKRTSSVLLAIALAGCAVVSAIADRTYDAVSVCYRAMKESVKLAFLRTVDVIATAKVDIMRPESERVQAKAYQARQEKRDRPVVTPGWRMCSSI